MKLNCFMILYMLSMNKMKWIYKCTHKISIFTLYKETIPIMGSLFPHRLCVTLPWHDMSTADCELPLFPKMNYYGKNIWNIPGITHLDYYIKSPFKCMSIDKSFLFHGCWLAAGPAQPANQMSGLKIVLTWILAWTFLSAFQKLIWALKSKSSWNFNVI